MGYAPLTQPTKKPRRFLRELFLFFHRPQHNINKLQPPLPEARVVQVHAKGLHQVIGRLAAAGGQQFEVAGHEGVALLLVAAVEGQDQQAMAGLRCRRRLFRLNSYFQPHAVQDGQKVRQGGIATERKGAVEAFARHLRFFRQPRPCLPGLEQPGAMPAAWHPYHPLQWRP